MTDIDWSKAPEGATHCRIGDHEIWLLCSYGVWRFWDGLGWSAPSVKPVGKVVPRAQKPEVEWDGSGRPPIGIWVEHNKHGHFVTTRIVGYDGILPVCSHGEGKYYGVPISCMRPIRTKEKRQRDELVGFIKSVDDGTQEFSPYDVADAILSRYNMEPKDV